MTIATRTRRTPGLSAEQRRARQDELLTTLADGVQALTTSDGWRRYLRAMTTLRTYSTGNSPIFQTRECGGGVIMGVPLGAGGGHQGRSVLRETHRGDAHLAF
jgi:hypothetical protein